MQWYTTTVKNSAQRIAITIAGGGNCAAKEGAWWHGYCTNSRLNYDMKKNKLYWRGFNYIKSTMMIRKIV